MTAFDTNVLIYSCDRSDARRQQRAFEVLAAADEGVLLWQVAAEFVAASRKLTSQGFTPAHAWARLQELMDVLRLIIPSPNVLGHAKSLHQNQGLSFWDAMIIGACIDCGVQTLYSEDLPGRAVEAQLRIVNPFRWD
jgi:predicted nucleic acid-binding protein